MGIVIKQSFWNSIWSYVGIAIGFINTLVLRPLYFSEDEIGIIGTVTNNALMMAPFVALGMPNTFIRFFAKLREDSKLESKVLSLQFAIILAANLIVLVIVFISLDSIKALYIEESPEYNQYIFTSLLIMILFSLFMQMHAFSRSKLNATIPSFLKETFLRFGNIILILLFSWEVISFSEMVNYLVVSYLMASLILAFYIVKAQHIKLTFDFLSVPSHWKKQLFELGSFNFVMSGCTSIYSNVGTAMIPMILGPGPAGIYLIASYIGLIVEMPKRAILQIIVPILGKEFNDNNFKEIDSLYKKVSINLGVIGFLVLIGVLTSLGDLFLIIPNGKIYQTGIYVTIGVATAKIIDMLFSFNSEFLYYTKFYRYNMILFVIISALIIILNYLLLPMMGIEGAAVAFFISTLLFNICKFIFIKIKFKISPFTKKHIPLTIYALLTFLIFWYLPISDNPIFNIIVRSIGISVVFIALVYISVISEDINRIIKTNVKKYLKITLP